MTNNLMLKMEKIKSPEQRNVHDLRIEVFEQWISELKEQKRWMNSLDHLGAGDIQIILLNNASYHIKELTNLYDGMIKKFQES